MAWQNIRSAGICVVVATLLLSASSAAHGQPEVKTVAAANVPTVQNSIGMKLALLPTGTFTMGADRKTDLLLEEEKTHNNNADSSWYDAELPQHKVTIFKSFYLGVYAVTQAEYEKVMESNPSWFAATGQGRLAVAGINTSRFPVDNVSWRDAQEFCVKLSAMEKRKYRLPTEEEWEYACRAGTTGPFSCGRTLTPANANFCEDPRGDKVGKPWKHRPVDVGGYPPNAFGLYDMHGNVWQWCQDLFTPKYSSAKGEAKPLNVHRVLRGGSWASLAVDCRSSRRIDGDPNRGDFFLGFRVALDLAEWKN